jgi:hypothetical protein
MIVNSNFLLDIGQTSTGTPGRAAVGTLGLRLHLNGMHLHQHMLSTNEEEMHITQVIATSESEGTVANTRRPREPLSHVPHELAGHGPATALDRRFMTRWSSVSDMRVGKGGGRGYL